MEPRKPDPEADLATLFAARHKPGRWDPWEQAVNRICEWVWRKYPGLTTEDKEDCLQEILIAMEEKEKRDASVSAMSSKALHQYIKKMAHNAAKDRISEALAHIRFLKKAEDKKCRPGKSHSFEDILDGRQWSNVRSISANSFAHVSIRFSHNSRPGNMTVDSNGKTITRSLRTLQDGDTACVFELALDPNESWTCKHNDVQPDCLIVSRAKLKPIPPVPQPNGGRQAFADLVIGARERLTSQELDVLVLHVMRKYSLIKTGNIMGVTTHKVTDLRVSALSKLKLWIDEP